MVEFNYLCETHWIFHAKTAAYYAKIAKTCIPNVSFSEKSTPLIKPLHDVAVNSPRTPVIRRISSILTPWRGQGWVLLLRPYYTSQFPELQSNGLFPSLHSHPVLFAGHALLPLLLFGFAELFNLRWGKFFAKLVVVLLF